MGQTRLHSHQGFHPTASESDAANNLRAHGCNLGVAEQIEVTKTTAGWIERLGGSQLLEQPIAKTTLLTRDPSRSAQLLPSHLPEVGAIELSLHRSGVRGPIARATNSDISYGLRGAVKIGLHNAD